MLGVSDTTEILGGNEWRLLASLLVRVAIGITRPGISISDFVVGNGFVAATISGALRAIFAIHLPWAYRGISDASRKP